jgi:GDP-D-mannose dehydratase
MELGNIEAKRDWSDAEDFVEGVWMMLNQEVYNKNYKGFPKEYVFSSNETHSIKEFVEKAFEYAGFRCHWTYNGIEIPENLQYETDTNSTSRYTPVTLVKINKDFWEILETMN